MRWKSSYRLFFLVCCLAAASLAWRGRSAAADSTPSGISPVLSASTLLGGSAEDEIDGIALDPNGNVYLAGTTSSPNLPVSFRRSRKPSAEIWITSSLQS